jgi:hypothetical protein
MHNGLVHRYIYMYELSMSVWLLLRALECNGESKLLFDETMPVFCASLQMNHERFILFNFVHGKIADICQRVVFLDMYSYKCLRTH